MMYTGWEQLGLFIKGWGSTRKSTLQNLNWKTESCNLKFQWSMKILQINTVS